MIQPEVVDLIDRGKLELERVWIYLLALIELPLEYHWSHIH